ncbi:hypothetical protein BH11PAT2_BH11PAT2_00510 [soil metagenome]
MEKADPTQPGFDIRNITFGDRIFFSEKLRGESAHTKFLWKVKKLRDDLSHGRIETLSYEGGNVFDKKVKAQMLTDYITLMNGIDDQAEGGFMATLTETEKIEIEQEFERLKEKLDM